MDIAGYCESCDRWFACVMDELDRFVCAWCGQKPIRLKGRDARADHAPVPVGRGGERPA